MIQNISVALIKSTRKSLSTIQIISVSPNLEKKKPLFKPVFELQAQNKLFINMQVSVLVIMPCSSCIRPHSHLIWLTDYPAAIFPSNSDMIKY